MLVSGVQQSDSVIHVHIYIYIPLQSLKRFFFFKLELKTIHKGFPGGAVVENLPANAGDTGSSPGLGRSHMPWSN